MRLSLRGGQMKTVISDGGGGRVVTRVRSGASASAKVLIRRVSRRPKGTGCRAPCWEPWLTAIALGGRC